MPASDQWRILSAELTVERMEGSTGLAQRRELVGRNGRGIEAYEVQARARLQACRRGYHEIQTGPETELAHQQRTLLPGFFHEPGRGYEHPVDLHGPGTIVVDVAELGRVRLAVAPRERCGLHGLPASQGARGRVGSTIHSLQEPG